MPLALFIDQQEQSGFCAQRSAQSWKSLKGPIRSTPGEMPGALLIVLSWRMHPQSVFPDVKFGLLPNCSDVELKRKHSLVLWFIVQNWHKFEVRAHKLAQA